MTKRRLIQNIKDAQRTIEKLTPVERAKLERSWDIEHAYHSSAIEGSKVTEREFSRLAEGIK